MPFHYKYMLLCLHTSILMEKNLKHAYMITFFINYCKLFSKCKELFLASKKGLTNRDYQTP